MVVVVRYNSHRNSDGKVCVWHWFSSGSVLVQVRTRHISDASWSLYLVGPVADGGWCFLFVLSISWKRLLQEKVLFGELLSQLTRRRACLRWSSTLVWVRLNRVLNVYLPGAAPLGLFEHSQRCLRTKKNRLVGLKEVISDCKWDLASSLVWTFSALSVLPVLVAGGEASKLWLTKLVTAVSTTHKITWRTEKPHKLRQIYLV